MRLYEVLMGVSLKQHDATPPGDMKKRRAREN
jgi:hypothetical protein